MTVGKNGTINEPQYMPFIFGHSSWPTLLQWDFIIILYRPLSRPPIYVWCLHSPIVLFKTHIADEMVILFVFSVFSVSYSNPLEIFPKLLTPKLLALESPIHSSLYVIQIIILNASWGRVSPEFINKSSNH